MLTDEALAKYRTPEEIEARKILVANQTAARLYRDGDFEAPLQGLNPSRSVWVQESDLAKPGRPIWVNGHSCWIVHESDRARMGQVFASHEVLEIRPTRQMIKALSRWLAKRTEALQTSIEKAKKAGL